MPGFDKTGPQGRGPMSGNAQGTCRAAGSEISQEQVGVYGQGRGRRQGRGFRCGMRNRPGRRLGWSSNQLETRAGELNE